MKLFADLARQIIGFWGAPFVQVEKEAYAHCRAKRLIPFRQHGVSLGGRSRGR